MLEGLKRFLKNERKQFLRLCKTCKIPLSYSINKSEFDILRSIFIDREYADYFPFYRNVTVIDIGAHYGYFSIFAHLNTDKNSTIIAIEPSENNFKKLNTNIKDCSISNIRRFNYAIGKENRFIKLFKGKNINHSIVKNYPLLKNSDTYEEVEMKTLSDILEENDLDYIDFLKIDCEGAEYSILENLPKSIFEKINTISMEFHDMKDKEKNGETLIRILRENSFEIVKYTYDKSAFNLNYGKIIGTKILKA